MRRKTPARWTLKNLRQFYFSKLKAKVVTDEYEYEEYDKKGNWTKRISYQDDKPYQIEEREIEYY